MKRPTGKIARVIRLVTYEGPIDGVKDILHQAIKGRRDIDHLGVRIEARTLWCSPIKLEAEFENELASVAEKIVTAREVAEDRDIDSGTIPPADFGGVR